MDDIDQEDLLHRQQMEDLLRRHRDLIERAREIVEESRRRRAELKRTSAATKARNVWLIEEAKAKVSHLQEARLWAEDIQAGTRESVHASRAASSRLDGC